MRTTKNQHLTAEQLDARQRFGAVLRARRQDLGLSQQAVADRAGVSFSTISLWESGGREGGLRLDALVDLSAALDCRLRIELVDGAGPLEVATGEALPPELEALRKVWGQLDDRGRMLIRTAIDLAPGKERQPSGGRQQLA